VIADAFRGISTTNPGDRFYNGGKTTQSGDSFKEERRQTP
jgi:hypothetical protein